MCSNVASLASWAVFLIAWRKPLFLYARSAFRISAIWILSANIRS